MKFSSALEREERLDLPPPFFTKKRNRGLKWTERGRKKKRKDGGVTPKCLQLKGKKKKAWGGSIRNSGPKGGGKGANCP